MEVKPTFFSVTGFLVPGIVFAGSAALLFGIHYRRDLPQLLVTLSSLPKEGPVSLALGTAIVAALLAFTFAAGSVLSETFAFVARHMLCPLLRHRLRLPTIHELEIHATLKDLVLNDENARDAFIFMETSELDLYWFSGRNRMMGTTGMALLGTTVIALALTFPWPVPLVLGTFSLWSLLVAAHRGVTYDQYMLSTAVLLLKRKAQTPAHEAGNA